MRGHDKGRRARQRGAQPADESGLEAVRVHQVELTRTHDAPQRGDRARVVDRVQRPCDRDGVDGEPVS